PRRPHVADRPGVLRWLSTRLVGSRRDLPGAVSRLRPEQVRLGPLDRRRMRMAVLEPQDVERLPGRVGVALAVRGLAPAAVRVLPAQQLLNHRAAARAIATQTLIQQ